MSDAPHFAPDEPIIVGILYPTAFWNDAEGWARDVEMIKAVDPRIEVIFEEYSETHELRTMRAQKPREELQAVIPKVTDAQRQALAQIDVALTLDLPYDIADLAPKLKWVQGLGVGSAQLQSCDLLSAGIRLTNAAGTSAVGMSEFVFARILQHMKHLRELDETQAKHEWTPQYGERLEEKTMGLIGYGAINKQVAVRAKAFGLNLLAMHRSATPGNPPPMIDEVFKPDDLHTMLGRSDIVVAAVPETAATEQMMDAAAFKAMKPGALFCNVGRGTLVDEMALIDALESGHLAAALLDVASSEPLAPEHPLWKAPNLYLSPHCSTASGEIFHKLHVLLAENLERWLAGDPLINEVDLTLGY
jgi:phosphoglycerate dehydrogenase-like enzyme